MMCYTEKEIVSEVMLMIPTVRVQLLRDGAGLVLVLLVATTACHLGS